MNKLRHHANILIVLVLLAGIILPVRAMAAEETGTDAQKGGGVVKVTPDEMWQKAIAALDDKDREEAVELFSDLHEKFPDDSKGQESLWRAAELTKELANEGDADWEDAKDLFRDYSTFYPRADNIAQAYLEVGISFYHMNFYREALSYFKLCLKRFPEDKIAGEVQLWQARVLIDIGRIDEADSIFRQLVASGSEEVKLRAILGTVEIYNLKKDYYSSLKIYHDLFGQDPNLFLKEIEVLRIFGQVNLLAGNVEKGQSQLIHYLNLNEDPSRRAEVLFEVGESYRRQKKDKAAQKMYKRAVEEGRQTTRPVVFSQVRIAEYLDGLAAQGGSSGSWSEPYEITDPQGDQPYLVALDLYYNDPLAQEARRGLFRRFKAREDIDNMYDYGNNFMRIARQSNMVEAKNEVGQVFLELADKLLEHKRYQDIYDMYYSEYEFIKDFPNGKLLFVVGQAMDALAMYDQASVIYYRAVKWPLSEKDKINLYYKRARVYLAKDDLDSAERLLKYLRKIYKDKKEAGEIYYLSGQLREKQNKPQEALSYYQKAAEVLTFPEKKKIYASDVIVLALKLDPPEALKMISLYKGQEYLAGSDLQNIYALAGDTFRENGNNQQAVEVYLNGLVEGLPQDGKVFQKINLYLGDSLVATGAMAESVKYYEKAVQGEDSILKQLAQERLNQQEIDAKLSKLKVGGEN